MRYVSEITHKLYCIIECPDILKGGVFVTFFDVLLNISLSEHHSWNTFADVSTQTGGNPPAIRMAVYYHNFHLSIARR